MMAAFAPTVLCLLVLAAPAGEQPQVIPNASGPVFVVPGASDA